MEDLIKALQILMTYGNPKYPTWCEHDTLHIDINPNIVSQEDKGKLEALGIEHDDESFYSYKFGSC